MEWKQVSLNEFFHFCLERTHLEEFESCYLYSTVAFLYSIFLQVVVLVLMESPFVREMELAAHLHLLDF